MEPEDIKEKLKESLTRKDDKKRIPGFFYASEAGYCPRKIYYSFKKKTEYGVTTMGIFRIGNMMHEVLQNLYEKNEDLIVVEPERRTQLCFDDFNITGHIDLYLMDKYGKRMIYEFKTVNNIYYIRKERKPNSTHIAQLMIYLKAERLEEGFLVYVDRRNFDMEIIKVKFDEKLYKSLIAKFRLIQEHMNNGTLPPMQAEDWECKYCNFQEDCLNEEVRNSKRPSNSGDNKDEDAGKEPAGHPELSGKQPRVESKP